jgi:hypothetical protein
MLSALSEEGVEFLLVGAYALAVHGLPRATGDLDIWIRPAPDNAGRTLEAIRRFGAPLQDLTEADLVEAGTVFQIGVPPRRIDLMTAIDGVTFEDAWATRLSARLGDLEVPVIGRDALLRNKRATGRPRDLADAEALERGD